MKSKTIITWFKTVKDVVKTLEFYEKTTDFEWRNDVKPTSKENKEIWEEKFKENQKALGFYLDFKDEFWFWSVLGRENQGYKYIKFDFKDLLDWKTND